MSFAFRFSVCALLCLVLAGCAANDLVVKRQAEADAKIERLLQNEKLNMQNLNELTVQSRLLDEQTRKSAARLDELQAELQQLRRAHLELQARLDSNARQKEVQKIELVNQEPPVRGKDSGPPQAYLKAFGLYSANNFTAAIEAFEAFIKHSPRSDYVANAHYWIGECYYSQSNLPKAMASFSKTADTYPRSPKAPDALLKLGYTLSAMKEKEKARGVFESIIRKYPGSMAAGKARERLMSK